MQNLIQRVFPACLLMLATCASDAEQPAARSGNTYRQPARDIPDSAVLRAGQLPGLCEHDRGDKVRDVFCSDPPPEITSLSDLQTLLGTKPDQLNRAEDLYGASAFVTLLGHSTALSGHHVSPLNPRLLVIGEGTIMAFQRGVQKLEVITEARNPGFFNFYLFQFEQACNKRPDGCSPGDLYGPDVEQNWLRVAIQDDEDIKNTPNDCLQCHQRGDTFRQLLMRELNNPWTHFFQPLPESPDQFLGPGIQGHDLLQDYLDAKGDERYGGFDPRTVIGLAPFVLETTVGREQPVLFDAPGIENERFPYDEGYPKHPGPSPTWQAAFEAFRKGEQLALPYLEVRVTDLDKQREHSAAYTRYRDGEIDAHELPDFADIFPDDPQTRAYIGLQTDPDASAEEGLIQACASCHNDVLDQSISRARFNVDLWKLDRSEIALAMERISRAPGSLGVMPPPEARQLDPKVRKRLLDYLKRDPLAREPDERLQRAAALGMSGGKDRRAFVRR